MNLIFITLVFSLVLGPDVMLLNAEEASTGPTSMQTNQNMVFSQVTESSPGMGLGLTVAEETTFRSTALVEDKFSTVENITSEVEEVTQTSEEQMTTSELPTTSKVPTTPETTAVQVHITTYNPSTLAAPAETTSQPVEETVTTEDPRTPSPPPTIPESTATTTFPSAVTSTPASPEKVTDTSQTTMPMPRPTTTIIITTTTTTITTTTIQEQTTLEPIDTDTPSAPFSEETWSPTNISTGISFSSINIAQGMGNSQNNDDTKKESNWLIIAIIALVAFCIVTTLCVMAIIMKRRKRSGKQSFGSANGKKGTNYDVWAGPMPLAGGDCEGMEEGDAQGEEKKTDGAEGMGLSTFVTVEENGGVGRPGSPEAEKWEEKEPLLFIDQEGKEKAKEAGKSEDADAKGGAEKSEDADAKGGAEKSEDADATGGAEKTDAKEAELNGRETFCLTTAV